MIELMVVIVLVGILSALMIPEMRGTYEDALLRATSRQLIDTFHVAYSRAVSLNQPHRFRFEPETHRYVLERQVWARGGQEFMQVRDVPGAEGQLDERIAVRIRVREDSANANPMEQASASDTAGGRTDEVSFYPDGTADGAEVLLEDRQGFRLLLRLDAVTARVRVFEAPK